MKISHSLKTLIRAPLKTLLTFFILAATSYMFFLNAAEYAVTAREYGNSVGFYQGVGAVETEAHYGAYPYFDYYLYTDSRVAYNPYGDSIERHQYKEISKADIDTISKLPHVTTSMRYMTAGYW